MSNSKSSAVTLIELIMVVSMIGILSAVGITSYDKSKNKSLSREAVSNLKLMGAAERIYKMEDTNVPSLYAACGTAALCNDKLNLNLNETTNANWTYIVLSTGQTVTMTATGTAKGLGAGCVYTLRSDTDGSGFDLEPTNNGGC